LDFANVLTPEKYNLSLNDRVSLEAAAKALFRPPKRSFQGSAPPDNEKSPAIISGEIKLPLTIVLQTIGLI
jgi:hypothetical protein